MTAGFWKHVGRQRPPFAVEPGPGQESVWDYPRPPRLEPHSRAVTVRLGANVIAESRRAVRVLETASPPAFYIPPQDVRTALLHPALGSSFCEWKGTARYWDVVVSGTRIESAAWSYAAPGPAFSSIAGYLSFYPALLECFVAGERVRPQPGMFYGGWVTSELAGPFKGDPGTEGW